MPVDRIVQCEYLADGGSCNAIALDKDGQIVRKESCLNGQKDHCCYECTLQKDCGISCTYLGEKHSARRARWPLPSSCPSCGSSTQEGWTLCPYCGTNLPASPYPPPPSNSTAASTRTRKSSLRTLRTLIGYLLLLSVPIRLYFFGDYVLILRVQVLGGFPLETLGVLAYFAVAVVGGGILVSTMDMDMALHVAGWFIFSLGTAFLAWPLIQWSDTLPYGMIKTSVTFLMIGCTLTAFFSGMILGKKAILALPISAAVYYSYYEIVVLGLVPAHLLFISTLAFTGVALLGGLALLSLLGSGMSGDGGRDKKEHVTKERFPTNEPVVIEHDGPDHTSRGRSFVYDDVIHHYDRDNIYKGKSIVYDDVMHHYDRDNRYKGKSDVPKKQKDEEE